MNITHRWLESESIILKKQIHYTDTINVMYPFLKVRYMKTLQNRIYSGAITRYPNPIYAIGGKRWRTGRRIESIGFNLFVNTCLSCLPAI